MNSFRGKMLYVDLTSRKIESRAIPEAWVDLYAGQKGLGTRLLMENFSFGTDPFSPENRIVLATSILSGTIVSSSSKLAIVSKSPQTGAISDGSVGGHIGAELKYAGYDAVVIAGKADSLSYLYIDPEKVEIRSAEMFRGFGTFETGEAILEATGDREVKTLVIGPAGENLIPFACICSEKYRQLGRGGMGAVMGSKRLKAIAVRGWLDIHVPDIEECMQVVAEIHKTDNVYDKENVSYTDGTPVLLENSQKSGLLPTKNFQYGTFEEYEKIDSAAFKEIRIHKKACFACGIACGNFVRGGRHEIEGPEYETIALAGSNINNSDKEKLIEFNILCDDLGLDTISTGGVIGFMMEMTEKGMYDFGIRFGDTDKALDFIKDIADLRGFGRDAALGVKSMSEKYGGIDFAIHVKGMELPGYDPRGSWGMALSYVTAPRGGCHMSAYPIESEAWGDLNPFTFEGKPGWVSELQNAQFAKFSIGICDFWPITKDTLARLFEVTYGGSWSGRKMLEIGERIFNLQRMFNVMAGFTRQDDILPGRFHRETLSEGPPKGKAIPREAFEAALDEYYSVRGWDSQGRPGIPKLEELKIERELIDAYRTAISGSF